MTLTPSLLMFVLPGPIYIYSPLYVYKHKLMYVYTHVNLQARFNFNSL